MVDAIFDVIVIHSEAPLAGETSHCIRESEIVSGNERSFYAGAEGVYGGGISHGKSMGMQS